MADLYIVLTAAQASTAATRLAWIDKLLDYPRDGVNVGGGIHAPAAQSRTTRHTSIITHPTDGRIAIRVDAVIRWIRNHPEIVGSKLTLAQRDALYAAIDGAVALDATWFPAPAL